MIYRLSVAEIYNHPGFEAMIEEYGRLTDPLLPAPPTPAERKHNYLELEERGVLIVWGAIRHGSIVGFATCIRGSIPHYGASIAIVESLYLMDAWRASPLGNNLLTACEDAARIWGVPQIFIQVHEEELKTLGTILARRNYSARIHTYGRRI